MNEITLNFYTKVDIDEWMNPEVRDKIRFYLLENCKGQFMIIYGPSSIISETGKVEIMDRSYTFIFFENKKDLLKFKLKWSD